jgi:CDP-glucose 4,6-dehydratase
MNYGKKIMLRGIKFKDLHKTFTNKKILVTGHTGFKGSWLTLFLKRFNAKLYGISLNALNKNDHFNTLNSRSYIKTSIININNLKKTRNEIKKINPDFIFHLAAQPLVRESYKNPIDTWTTNVIGTLNLLKSSLVCKNLKGILVITSDKCYENNEWIWGYRENDTLGGHDPYSSSKAGCEIAVKSFYNSFLKEKKISLCTVRAGNVIGGGDWSKDRLIPDIFESIKKKKKILIRNPKATRPWQHVLDCTYAYILLAQKMLKSKKNNFYDCFNIGPEISSNKNVISLIKEYKKINHEINFKIKNKKNYKEAQFLYLDNSKIKKYLDWQPALNYKKSLLYTFNWYEKFIFEKKCISETQVNDYIKQINL